MEGTKGVEDLLHKILPPRVEDAGLEDCALPPDAIHEAFRKAAAAAAASDGRCTADSLPSGPSDALVDITDGPDPAAGACKAEKGVITEVAVVGTEAEEKVEDAVVVGRGNLPEKGEARVDELLGVEVEERVRQE